MGSPGTAENMARLYRLAFNVLSWNEYLVKSSEEGNEMSKFNRAEIEQVVYQCLVKGEGVNPGDINIMSQYNAQCSKIRASRSKRQHRRSKSSLVRSLPGYRIELHPTDGWRTENLGFINDDHQINQGFINDDHQINVALTRARKGLVTIGNRQLMQCNEIFKTLLEDYGRHGCMQKLKSFPQFIRGRNK